VFFRTYSRRRFRAWWDEVCDRNLQGLTAVGKLTPEEVALIDKMQRQSLPAGAGYGWVELSGFMRQRTFQEPIARVLM